MNRAPKKEINVYHFPFAGLIDGDRIMRELEENQPSTNTVIFMKDTDILNKKTFSTFAKKFNPACLFDFRIAPRLDTFANTRLLAFRLFKDLEMEYFDFLGRAGVTALDEFKDMENPLAKSLDELWHSPNADTRPIIFFFDSESLLLECRRTMPRLNQHFGGKLKVADYRSGFLSFRSTFP